MELIEDNEYCEPEQEIKELKQKKGTTIKKLFLLIIGTISLILGIIGIFLPILPTTPFLLVSASCFFKSSKRAYNWLLNNKIFGEIIRNYREGKGLPMKTKIFTITLLWVTISISILFINILWIRFLLLAIAIIVTIHIKMIKPKKSKEQQEGKEL